MIYEAFKILKENDNELPGKEVIRLVGERIELDDWASVVYETSGYVRWKTILNFFSSGCVKAGFLRKNKSIWYLTPEGEEALKLGPKGLLSKVDKLYNEWKSANPKVTGQEQGIDTITEEEVTEDDNFTLDQIEQMAMSSIKNKISAKKAYEFQD
jgi:restriction system protein